MLYALHMPSAISPDATPHISRASNNNLRLRATYPNALHEPERQARCLRQPQATLPLSFHLEFVASRCAHQVRSTLVARTSHSSHYVRRGRRSLADSPRASPRVRPYMLSTRTRAQTQTLIPWLYVTYVELSAATHSACSAWCLPSAYCDSQSIERLSIPQDSL